MSDTPKKKTTPAKKQAQKKTASPKGTGKPGRPKKEVAPKPEVAPKVEKEEITTTDFIAEPAKAPEKEVVIHATNVKKPSLRKRMLKWFK